MRLLGTSYVPGRPGPAWACHPILERPAVRLVSPPRVAKAPEPSQTGCSMIAYASLAGGPSINIETSRHRDIGHESAVDFFSRSSMIDADRALSNVTSVERWRRVAASHRLNFPAAELEAGLQRKTCQNRQIQKKLIGRLRVTQPTNCPTRTKLASHCGRRRHAHDAT